MSDDDRLWSRIEPEPNSGCWLWIGGLFSNGYAAFWWGGRTGRGHRYSYIQKYGPIPEELVLDHKCRVRSCVNPDHLEAVTVAENIRRGEGGQEQARRTHCLNGHPFDETNTYWVHGTRKRHCRACGRDVKRRSYQARNRAGPVDPVETVI